MIGLKPKVPILRSLHILTTHHKTKKHKVSLSFALRTQDLFYAKFHEGI